MKAMTVMLLLSLMVSCGSDPEDTQEVLVLNDKLVCTSNEVCSGDKIVCNRANYYSQEWNCTVFMRD